MNRRGAAILAVSFVLSFLANAQNTIVPRSEFVLNFDDARFRYDDTTGYVEFYYVFFPRLISYQLRENLYRGGVVVQTIVGNKGKVDTVVYANAYLPVEIRDTSDVSLKYSFVSQAGYKLPFGEYDLRVLARDSLTPSRFDSANVSFSVMPYSTLATGSDIELCSSIKSSQKNTDLFFKNSLEVVPNPTLIYGATSHPVVLYYLELYNIDPDRVYMVKTQIVSLEGAVLKEAVKSRKYTAKNVVETGNMLATSIYSGKYHLRVVVGDTLGSEIVKKEKSFFIYNPHIKQPQFVSSSVRVSELARLSNEELAEEFRRAKYIATDEQIRSFSRISSAEGRREFLATFWANVEAGRSPAMKTILRSEYLRRVEIADERYHTLYRDGWRTDRGRVYIIYGEPDETERYPSSQNSKPYETWHYYRIENGVEFDFIDRSGFGEYVLVNSTKRGEIQDDQWQQYLQ